MIRDKCPNVFAWMVVVSIISLGGGCAAPARNQDNWFGPDKLYHFAAATAFGAGSQVVASNNGASESNAAIIGVSVAIGVGAAKELYDQELKRTGWSWKDLVWDVAGGIVGSLTAKEFR